MTDLIVHHHLHEWVKVHAEEMLDTAYRVVWACACGKFKVTDSDDKDAWDDD